MMTFFVEHPYWSYLLISIVFGAYMHARFTVEQMRILAKNYNKIADKMEEIQKQYPLPVMWTIGNYLVGFFWPIAIVTMLFGTLKRAVFGVEEITIED